MTGGFFMFKKKILVAVTAGMLALSSSAFATTQFGPGLGWLLLKDTNNVFLDMVGVILNGICCNQCFAITSGSWGYNGGLIGMTEADKFVADNMDALATDIAKGEGEYVDTLSTLLSVSDAVAFKAALQSNFDEIFSSSEVSTEEVCSKIHSLVI